MEKCIGCELCAAVCPADCIYVRGLDNPPDAPVSPGERYGFVYEINYLRCIHCDLCVEACPTEAITESKMFEFSFTSRSDAIYTKERARGRRRRPAPAASPGRTGDRARTSTPRAGCGRRRPRARSSTRARRSGRPSSVTGVRPAEGGQSGKRDDAATGNISIRTVERDKISRRLRGQGARHMTTTRCSRPRSPTRSPSPSPAAICVVRALGVVLARNPVHSALMLVMTLFGVAVLFVEEDAQFLAAVQVIVYAGAIVVLFLFVIMLLGVDRNEAIARRASPRPAADRHRGRAPRPRRGDPARRGAAGRAARTR